MFKPSRRKRKRGNGGPRPSRFRLRKQAGEKVQRKGGTAKHSSPRENVHENGKKVIPDGRVSSSSSLREESINISHDDNEFSDNSEYKWNMKILGVIGCLRIFPVSYDVSPEGGGRAKMDDGSGWSIYRFYAWLIWASARQLWINVDLVTVFLDFVEWMDKNKNGSKAEASNSEASQSDNQNKLFGFFAMIIVSVVGTSLIFLICYIVWISKGIDTSCIVYNSCLDLRKEIPEFYASFKSESSRQKGFRGFWNKIWTEPRVLVFSNLPFLMYSVLFCVTMIMIVMPRSPILLSSIAVEKLDLGLTFSQILKLEVNLAGIVDKMSVNWKWLVVYVLLAILDHLYFFYVISIGYVGTILMLVFMERMQQHSKMVCEYLRGTDLDSGLEPGYEMVKRLETGIKQLKLMKLQIILFNSCLSLVVYLTKILTIVIATIGGFGCIKLFSVNTPQAATFFIMFFEGLLVYSILFDSAYQVGENLEALKSDILAICSLELKWPKQSIQRQVVERIIKSIQELGIKAGSFHTIERESTLIFCEFVVEQIVDLLLTF